jgi:hypothetical protein
MAHTDNPINMRAWYFRLADLAAPFLIGLASAVALVATVNLVTTF